MINSNSFNNLTLQERRFALLLDVFSESEQVRIQKAYEYANIAHATQKRDGGQPYIIHPLRVALILLEAKERDADLIIAALLHDVVEDTEKTIEDIQKQYNERIAQLVQDATRPRPEHETEEMKREAKVKKFQWYIAEASIDSCKLKSADVIDNMRNWQFIPLDHPTQGKFPRWCREAITYYPDLTKKAGSVYYELFRELVESYYTLPLFHKYLQEEYHT